MNKSALQGGVFVTTLPAGWNVIDVADFNRNGNLDYALFNARRSLRGESGISPEARLSAASLADAAQRLGAHCDS